MRFKRVKVLLALLCSLLILAGCGKQEEKPLTIAAAASLEKIFTQRLIPLFNEHYPKIKIEGTYSGSGNLQLQIEQGQSRGLSPNASGGLTPLSPPSELQEIPVAIREQSGVLCFHSR